MNETVRILCAIPEKASISITALLARLGIYTIDLSSPIFTTLNTLEDSELITVIRPGNGRVASVQLTALGAERAREAITGQDRCPECVAAKTKRAERL